MNRVLITGARGMLGTSLTALAPAGTMVMGFDIEDGDLTTQAGADAVVAGHPADVVIHCAAMTDVDGCTRDPQRAMRVNGEATANVAQACRQSGAKLIYISTDYVFAGDLGRSYTENDKPHPLNPYGDSKLAGEQAVAELENHLIVRTQWLYGPQGKNFVATMVNLARKGQALRVVADEWGSPTYTRDLAAALWQVALADVTGILHITNSGVCTWHELASLAVQTAGLAILPEPISRLDWASPTTRPSYSPLAGERWLKLGYEPLRPWQEATVEYVSTFLQPTGVN